MTSDEKILIVFGERVRKLRMILNISQEELAFRSSLHRNYISDLERGKRNVSLIAISKIAKGLNVSVDTLFIEWLIYC
jgi:transcriptional regulator with XRE-family HTH domain